MDFRGERAGRNPDDYLSSVGVARINFPERRAHACNELGLWEAPWRPQERADTESSRGKEKKKGSAKKRLRGKHNMDVPQTGTRIRNR